MRITLSLAFAAFIAKEGVTKFTTDVSDEAIFQGVMM